MQISIDQYSVIENSLGKHLKNGFKSFIKSLMSSKEPAWKAERVPFKKRNFFLEKYQQLLAKGRTGNVQVMKVEHSEENMPDKSIAIYLSFQLITDEGVRLFTAAAVATQEKIPVCRTIISIFYNPEDFSVIVLL